ncbi:MAG: ABC transporter ATP-binding protein [Cellulosilyticaceae bacterium]
MIEVKGLTKQYGKHLAVNDISFKVEAGEILGFLGPNGAGKSTTMNMLTGYLSATEGEIKINGIDILENPTEAKKHIGYLPELPPIYMDMTAMEYLRFVAKLKKVDKKTMDAHLDEIMETVQITGVAGRLIKNLSKGYKQRIGLAQALIGAPEVLILDEPTVGLDPKQMIEIRNLVKDLSKTHTIILSSHILSEVSAVCDRVMIMNKGDIVASDTPDGLSRRLSGTSKLVIRVKEACGDLQEVLLEDAAIASVTVDRQKEAGTMDMIVEAEDGADIREIVFRICSTQNTPLLMMKSLDISLEDIFLQVTSGEEVQAVMAEDCVEEREDASC